MILSYGNILFIVFIIVILFFVFYILLSKRYLMWDQFKIGQLEYFITHNTDLYNEYNFLTKDKQNCFYNNFTKNVSYKEFSDILDIKIKSTFDEEYRTIYLNNNNKYQTFILRILKYISECLGVKIPSDLVCLHLNNKIKGNEDEIKNKCNEIAKKLNQEGYTLYQFNYLDKFYVDPETNPSNAQVIKNFVNLLNKLIK